MKINWKKVNRKTHYWGAVICAIPILIVIVTGVLLLLKKEIHWVQPPTIKGPSKVPELSFEQIMSAVKAIPEAGIENWSDVDRLDVRPNKGVIKVRANNQWEIQLDQQTMKVLQVAYRRSDFIESIHDGSYFHDVAKLGLFLPSAVILLVLWITGMYLFFITLFAKQRAKTRRDSLCDSR